MKIITTILFILFSFISFSQKSGYLVGNANGSFSIGTDVTTAPLTIANFTTSFPTPQSGTIVHLVSDAVTNGRLSFDTYNNNQFGSFYQGRKGLGSAGSPTAVTADSMFLNASKGETSWLTNNISTNIKAYTPMLPFTNNVDAEFQSRFQVRRRDGRDDFEN